MNGELVCILIIETMIITRFIISSDGYFKIDQYFLGIANEIKKWTKSSKIKRNSDENLLKVFRVKEKHIFQ